MKNELKKNKVYISGAMTDLDYREVYKRFTLVQRQLENEGYRVYNPCSVQLPAGSSHGEYMQADLPHLLSCDIVYFLDGWQRSHGCRYEMQVALSTDKDIRFENWEKYHLPLQNPRMAWLHQAAEAMQTNVGDILGRKRDRYLCDRRLAIIVFLFTRERMDFKSIARLIRRDSTTCYQHFCNRYKARAVLKPLIQALESIDPIPPEQAEPQPLPLFNNLNEINNETITD